MNYYIHKPGGILDPYIKCIWCLDITHNQEEVCSQRIMPTGCIELTFYYGDQADMRDADDSVKTIPAQVISGQQTSYTDITCASHLGIVSVLLKPEAVNGLLPLPANQLNNLYVDARDLFGPHVNIITEKLYHAKDMQKRVMIIEDFLRDLLVTYNNDRDARVVEGVKQMAMHGGLLNIDDLSTYLNISKRQLERKFASVVGIAPKKFARIIRFQKVLAIKQQNPDMDLTTLAYQAGYADQAHFINDFKSISGMSPGQFFKQGPAFSDYYSY